MGAVRVLGGWGGGRLRHFDNGEGGGLFDNVLLDLPDFSVSSEVV